MQFLKIHFLIRKLKVVISITINIFSEKIQKIGPQQDYYNSSNDDSTCLKRLVQETVALAFMPVQEVNDLWCKMMDKFEHINRSQDFFDYFTEIWIDNGCLFPKFPWNYYKFHGSRTNNGYEEWHHRLNSNINGSNSNLYQVIDELKRNYAFSMVTMKQLISNTSKSRGNPNFDHRNQRTLDLMDRYDEGHLPLIEYFDKISQTIGKKLQSIVVVFYIGSIHSIIISCFFSC